MTSQDREWLILANRSIWLALLYFGLLFPLATLTGLIQLIVYHEHPEDIKRIIAAFAPPVAAGAVMSIGALLVYYRFRTRWSPENRERWLDFYLVCCCGLWYWNSHLAPIQLPFSLYTILGLPFFLCSGARIRYRFHRV